MASRLCTSVILRRFSFKFDLASARNFTTELAQSLILLLNFLVNTWNLHLKICVTSVSCSVISFWRHAIWSNWFSPLYFLSLAKTGSSFGICILFVPLETFFLQVTASDTRHLSINISWFSSVVLTFSVRRCPTVYDTDSSSEYCLLEYSFF